MGTSDISLEGPFDSLVAAVPHLHPQPNGCCHLLRQVHSEAMENGPHPSSLADELHLECFMLLQVAGSLQKLHN